MNNMFKTFKKITSCALSTVITLSSIVLTQSTILKAASSDFDCKVETKPIKQLPSWCWITSTQMTLRSFLQKEGKLNDDEYIHLKYGEECIKAINAYYKEDKDPCYHIEETSTIMPIEKKSMKKFETLYNEKIPTKDQNEINKEAAFLVYLSSYRLDMKNPFTSGVDSEASLALGTVLKATGLSNNFMIVDLATNSAGQGQLSINQKLGLIYTAVKKNNSAVISHLGGHYNCITGIENNQILVQETSGGSVFKQSLDYLKNYDAFVFIIDKTKDNTFVELNPNKSVYNNGDTINVFATQQLLDASLQVKSNTFNASMCTNKQSEHVCFVTSTIAEKNASSSNDAISFYQYNATINKDGVLLNDIVNNSKLNGEECIKVHYISNFGKEQEKITYVKFNTMIKAPSYESIFGESLKGHKLDKWVISDKEFNVGDSIDISKLSFSKDTQLRFKAQIKTNVNFNVYYEDNGSYPSKPNVSEKIEYIIGQNLNKEISSSLATRYANNHDNKYVLDTEKTKKDAEKYFTNYDKQANHILPSSLAGPIDINLYYKKNNETAVVSFKVDDKIVNKQTVLKGTIGVKAPQSVKINGISHNILRWIHEADDKITVQNVLVDKDMTFIADGLSPTQPGSTLAFDDSQCYRCRFFKEPNNTTPINPKAHNNTAVIDAVAPKMMKNILSSSVAKLNFPPTVNQNGHVHDVTGIDCCMEEISSADLIDITIPNSVNYLNLEPKEEKKINPITVILKSPNTTISNTTCDIASCFVFYGLPNPATHKQLKNKFNKITFKNSKETVMVVYSKKDEHGKSRLLNPKDYGITVIDKWYTVKDQVVNFSLTVNTDVLFVSKILNVKVYTQTEDGTNYEYRPKYSFNVKYPYGASRTLGASGVLGTSRQSFNVTPRNIEGFEYNPNHKNNKTVMFGANDTLYLYYDKKKITPITPSTSDNEKKSSDSSSTSTINHENQLQEIHIYRHGSGPNNHQTPLSDDYNKKYSSKFNSNSNGNYSNGYFSKFNTSSKGSYGGGSGYSSNSGGSSGKSSDSGNTANQTPNSPIQKQTVPVIQTFEFEATRTSSVNAVEAFKEFIENDVILTNISDTENKALVFNTNKIDDQGQKHNLATWHFEMNKLNKDFVTKAREIITIQEKANAHQTNEAENTRLAQLKKDIDIYNFKLSVKQSSAEENTTLFEAAKQKLAGHNATVIDFTENKIFPGEAVVSVNFGKDKSNKEYIVVYVYKDEKTGFIVTKILSENCKVEANGYVNFRASHGANYVFLEKSDDNLKIAKELELTR